MKTISIVLTTLGLLLLSGMSMAHDNRGYSYGNNYKQQYGKQYHGSRYKRNQRRNQAYVLDITPVYRSSGRRHASIRSCRSSSRSHSHTGAIVGGVVGGVIGHEIGHRGSRRGHNNAATVAGAVVGAAIGNHYDRAHSSSRCVSSSRAGRTLKGYQLTYKYRGRVHKTFVTRKPPQYFRIDQLRSYS